MLAALITVSTVLTVVVVALLLERSRSEERHAQERRRLVSIAFADRPSEVAMLERAFHDDGQPEKKEPAGPLFPDGL